MFVPDGTSQLNYSEIFSLSLQSNLDDSVTEGATNLEKPKRKLKESDMEFTWEVTEHLSSEIKIQT